MKFNWTIRARTVEVTSKPTLLPIIRAYNMEVHVLTGVIKAA